MIFSNKDKRISTKQMLQFPDTMTVLSLASNKQIFGIIAEIWQRNYRLQSAEHQLISTEKCVTLQTIRLSGSSFICQSLGV